jgi:hypothetical protein
MRLTKAQERYLHDTSFHDVVNVMVSMLASNLVDTGSLLEAAVEAANIHYQRQVPHVVVWKGGEHG